MYIMAYAPQNPHVYIEVVISNICMPAMQPKII